MPTDRREQVVALLVRVAARLSDPSDRVQALLAAVMVTAKAVGMPAKDVRNRVINALVAMYPEVIDVARAELTRVKTDAR